jgi:hypothetical protein
MRDPLDGIELFEAEDDALDDIKSNTEPDDSEED